MTDIANIEQAERWSGPSGETWVTQQPLFDTLMDPVLDLLMEHASLQVGDRVIDIGCGTGASLLRAARIVGPAGHVLGLDVSRPMLDLARRRAEALAYGSAAIDCVLGDAQVYPFAPTGFDHVISRFGVMFFGDPVAAFANIRKALRSNGRLSFVSWAGMARNPWFRDPIEAATAVLGAPPLVDPRAPGPMAFSEPAYVQDILEVAGWSDITINTMDLHLTPPGTREEIVDFALREGPASRVMQEMGGSDADLAAIKTRLDKSMAKYETPKGLHVPAHLHVVTARATT
ncbi:MAG: class I SAM-dependent methyltransferase [Pseudomonadota bacterium]